MLTILGEGGEKFQEEVGVKRHMRIAGKKTLAMTLVCSYKLLKSR
jgi:hypothetical protein